MTASIPTQVQRYLDLARLVASDSTIEDESLAAIGAREMRTAASATILYHEIVGPLAGTPHEKTAVGAFRARLEAAGVQKSKIARISRLLGHSYPVTAASDRGLFADERGDDGERYEDVASAVDGIVQWFGDVVTVKDGDTVRPASCRKDLETHFIPKGPKPSAVEQYLKARANADRAVATAVQFRAALTTEERAEADAVYALTAL